MSSESREQQVDQLLRGVYRMCVNRDDCNGCPFYIAKCTFGEPKPKTWFDEETIEVKTPAEPVKAKEKKPVFFTAAAEQQEQQANLLEKRIPEIAKDFSVKNAELKKLYEQESSCI